MKSPHAVIILLLIPFFMTGLLGLIFSPSETKNKLPKIKVLVVDKDKNIASKFLIQAFENPQMKDMFALSFVDEKRGEELISKGKASALLIIPENFSSNILENKTSQFKLIKNPSQRFLPTIVEEFMNTFSVIVSGFVQIFAEEINGIRILTKIPMKDISIPEIIPFLEKSKGKIIALQDYLDPLLIQLKEELKKKEKKESRLPGTNIFAFILPAISIMFLLFIIESFIRDIITERENRTLHRIMFSAISPLEYILAKISSGWIMGIMVYSVVVGAGFLLFNISWGNYSYLFVFTAVTCFWIASFFALLNSFFKNRNQAGAITSPIIIIFSALGGSMVQVSSMPGSFQVVSQFTLNYWFIQGVEKITKGYFPLLSLSIILITGTILFLLSIKFLKRRIQA